MLYSINYLLQDGLPFDLIIAIALRSPKLSFFYNYTNFWDSLLMTIVYTCRDIVYAILLCRCASVPLTLNHSFVDIVYRITLEIHSLGRLNSSFLTLSRLYSQEVWYRHPLVHSHDYRSNSGCWPPWSPHRTHVALTRTHIHTCSASAQWALHLTGRGNTPASTRTGPSGVPKPLL